MRDLLTSWSLTLFTGSGDADAREVERFGTTKQATAVKASAGTQEGKRGEQAQGRKSADFTGSAAHELQLLKSEKAVIAGELQKEQEMRVKMQAVRFSSDLACCRVKSSSVHKIKLYLYLLCTAVIYTLLSVTMHSFHCSAVFQIVPVPSMCIP